ncbi:MAG: YigZ family protein [Clostridia bacterium]|nr:YigZ family protein [Clostridia bacterium]
MITVKKDSIFEFTEKKSVFIGQVFYAKTVDEAMEKVQSVRNAHPDATHVCWAYSVCGGTQRRASDDGEPQGTAGMPILHVLDTNGVADVVCTVTRYFGGILLGAGGLVRAYSKGAAGAVEEAGKTDVIEYKTISVTYGYDLHSSMERLFRLEELEPFDRDFSDKVTLYVEMPAEKFPAIAQTLEEQWYGRTEVVEISSEIRRRT